MNELMQLMHFAKGKYETAGDDIPTYQEDSEADHGDGQLVGRRHAYGTIIKECAKRISEMNL